MSTPVTSPSPRELVSLAYDSARQRVVLYGGYVPGVGALQDTWEWDGTDWIQRSPPHHPPPLYEYGIAYDSARGVTVLVGGATNRSMLTGTWEWDGNDWTERRTGPPARQRRLVLFGGREDDYSSSFSDTWEWDGASWVQRLPSTVPPGREDIAMAYDSTRGRVLLFAGETCPPFDECPPLGDTWEWDGNDWTARGTGPAARAYHALAHDRKRRRTVLFGGADDGLDVFTDTWELRSASIRPR